MVGDQERIGGLSAQDQYIVLRIRGRRPIIVLSFVNSALLSFFPFLLPDKDGNEIHFRVKKSTKLRKLKISYYKRKRSPWAQDSLHFLTFQYRGRGIRDEDTPETLQMEEGDIIEVSASINKQQKRHDM